MFVIKFFDDAVITREKAQLWAVALQILGEAYMSMKQEDTNIPPGSRFGDDAEYVVEQRSHSTIGNIHLRALERGSRQFGQFLILYYDL